QRRGEVGAEVEEQRLQGLEVGVEGAQRRALRLGPQRRARQAQRRVRLVDRAVGPHPRDVLRHAAAPEEPGGAVVPRARVDLLPAASAVLSAGVAAASASPRPKRLATYSATIAVKRAAMSSPCSVATRRPSW